MFLKLMDFSGFLLVFVVLGEFGVMLGFFEFGEGLFVLVLVVWFKMMIWLVCYCR